MSTKHPAPAALCVAWLLAAVVRCQAAGVGDPRVALKHVSVKLSHDVVYSLTGALISATFDDDVRLQRATNASAGLVRLLCGPELIDSFPADARPSFFPSHLIPLSPVLDTASLGTAAHLFDLPLYASARRGSASASPAHPPAPRSTPQHPVAARVSSLHHRQLHAGRRGHAPRRAARAAEPGHRIHRRLQPRVRASGRADVAPAWPAGGRGLANGSRRGGRGRSGRCAAPTPATRGASAARRCAVCSSRPPHAAPAQPVLGALRLTRVGEPSCGAAADLNRALPAATSASLQRFAEHQEMRIMARSALCSLPGATGPARSLPHPPHAAPSRPQPALRRPAQRVGGRRRRRRAAARGRQRDRAAVEPIRIAAVGSC